MVKLRQKISPYGGRGYFFCQVETATTNRMKHELSLIALIVLLFIIELSVADIPGKLLFACLNFDVLAL